MFRIDDSGQVFLQLGRQGLNTFSGMAFAIGTPNRPPTEAAFDQFAQAGGSFSTHIFGSFANTEKKKSTFDWQGHGFEPRSRGSFPNTPTGSFANTLRKPQGHLQTQSHFCCQGRCFQDVGLLLYVKTSFRLRLGGTGVQGGDWGGGRVSK